MRPAAEMPDLDVDEHASMASLRDIKERNHGQERHAEELLAPGTLASGIARELSNIFAVIRGNGALAAEMLPSDHDTQILLATIRSAAQRASQILEQIVTVSRPQDFLAPRLGPLDLGEFGSEDGVGRRVLCVSNDEDLSCLITDVLKRQGYQVTGFCDPFQAMQAFRLGGGDFDFAVLDLSMPMLSGLDFASELLRTHPDLPIVLVSARFGFEILERARSIGVAHCLTKADVVERLAQLLEPHALQANTCC